MSARRLAPLLLIFSACLARYAPPRLDPKTPLTLTVDGPTARVEVLLDARGIPHVFAEREADVAFGLGFMHGRDRTFQVLVMKHAARGRLTELFGADALPLDRRLRTLTWRLGDAFAALEARDRATLEAYAKGVTAGAAHAGTTAELALLGASFGTFTAEDSFAVMRLQSWSLAADFRDELARAQLLAKLAADDPRRALLDAPHWTGGVPIVAGGAPTQTERPTSLLDSVSALVQPGPAATAAGNTPTLPAQPVSSPVTGASLPSALELAGGPVALATLPSSAAELADRLGLEQLGASNSWAVHGSRTAAGVPVLCNDPHLNHELPSVFYLAHLEHPDFTGVGATFAGIPAVLIGHTRSLAWGMTVSYADTQDLVRLDPAPDGGFAVGGVPVEVTRVEQRFRLGRKEDAEAKVETWLETPFGPVLSDAWVSSPERYALLWPGFEVGGLNAGPVSGFWDFLRAKDADEATAAISRVQVSGQNVALAFTDGTIAYRLAAYAPLRPPGVSGRLPRTDAPGPMAERFLLQTEKPALTNPDAGYLVAANQRVLGDDDWRVRAVGTSGVPAHRARRIHQRLSALLGAKKPSADELLEVQQDITSLEAKDVIAVLAAACPAATPRHDAALVADFCAALRGFDGVFSTDSLGALPFVAVVTALRGQVVRGLGVDDAVAVKALARSFPVSNAVHLALRSGGRSPLFGSDLRAMMVAAVDDALDDVLARAGTRPSTWRWGAVHTLQFKGVLARAPLVGGFFTKEPVEQSGHANTVRAEAGLPVDHGAAMRMVVELSSPPRARFTIDTGQSGAPKEPHAFDQFPAWAAGAPRPMPMTRAEVEAEREGAFVLLPVK
ncbi:MAG: penicillin acylase family protein [Myxococcaceae bacterium]|nr:penicillin acylase family protein [Myxococcaceae bacterium]